MSMLKMLKSSDAKTLLKMFNLRNIYRRVEYQFNTLKMLYESQSYIMTDFIKP